MKKLFVCLMLVLIYNCYEDESRLLTYEVTTVIPTYVQVRGECNGFPDSLIPVFVFTPFVCSKKIYDNHKYFISIYEQSIFENPSVVVSDGVINIFLENYLIDSINFIATLPNGSFVFLEGFI